MFKCLGVKHHALWMSRRQASCTVGVHVCVSARMQRPHVPTSTSTLGDQEDPSRAVPPAAGPASEH